jgi:hypothetical protein
VELQLQQRLTRALPAAKGQAQASTEVLQIYRLDKKLGLGCALGGGSIRPQSQNLAQFNLSKNRLGRALFRVAAGLPFPCSLPSQIGGSQSHPLKTLLSKSQFPQFLFPQSNSIRFRLFAVPLFTANSHSRPICKPMSGKVPTPILTQITYDTFLLSVPNSAKIFKVFINFNCGVEHE